MKRLLLFLTCVLTLFGIGRAEVIAFIPTGGSYTGSGEKITFSDAITGGKKEGICSFSCSNGAINTGKHRWYANATLTIKPETGVTINKITWTDSANKGASEFTTTSGSVTKTGTGNNNAGYRSGSANSEFTIKTTKQVETAYYEIEYSINNQGGGESGNPDQPQGDGYKLVTDVKDLTEGDLYIIACTSSNKSYSMSTSTGNIQRTEVTINNNILTPANNSLILQLEKDKDGNYLWKVTNDGSYKNYYLTVSSSTGTGTALVNATTIGAGQKSSVDISNSKVKITMNTRILMYANSNSDFRAYVASNWTNNSYTQPSLYKKSAGPVVPKLPIVTLNGENITSDGSKVIGKGSTVSITCDNADQIKGIKNNVEFGSENLPFSFTVDTDTELEVWGINGDLEGEHFKYTFTIGEIDQNMPQVGSNFKQVLKNEEASEGYYVIASASSKEGSDNYAMSTTLGSTNIPATQNISVKNVISGGLTFDVLNVEEPDVLIVYIEQKDGQYAIKTVNYDDGFTVSQGYLAKGSGNNDLIVLKEFTPVDIRINQSNNAEISFTGIESSAMIKLGGTSNKYFNYQIGGSPIQIYQYPTKKVFDPQFTEQWLKGGDTYNIVLPEDAPENITFTVEGNSDAITFEGTTITAKEYISSEPATIVATWEEDENYFAGSAKFDVTVLFKAKLEFRHGRTEETAVRGKKGIGVVSQAAYYTGNGTVKYKSSHPLEVVVDENTGMIRPEDIEMAKIHSEEDKHYYIITAYVEGATDSYLVNAQDKYYIVIEESESGDTGELISTIEDFSSKDSNSEDNWYNLLPTGYSDDETKHKSKKTGIEYIMKQAMVASQSPSYFLQIRNDDAKGIGYLSFNIPQYCNEITFTAGASTSKYTKIDVIINEEVREEDVEFTNFISIQIDKSDWGKKLTLRPNTQPIKIEKIEYNITPIDNSKASGLSFDVNDSKQRIINIFAGEERQLPALKHNEDIIIDFKNIDFDIDEIEERDEDETFRNYEIIKNDFDDIKVTVYNPGVYTFRAKYEGDDFLNSMAILRLNVFPRLSITPNEDHDSEISGDDRNEFPQLTIVEPVTNQNGEMETVINLPSFDVLGDPLKYSTVSIKNVEIKHDTETKLYSDEDFAALNGKVPFNQDGYIKYSMVYANTDDFKIDQTVHVIMMPKVPNYELDSEENPTKVTLTPANNDHNAKLVYYTTYVNEVTNDDGPLLPNYAAKRRANFDIPADEWKEFSGASQEIAIEKQEGKTFEIYFRSVKDLTEALGEDAANNDTELVGPYTGFISIPYDGNAETGVEAIGAEEGDVRYFTPQGIQVANPEPGQIYIVVKGNKASKVLF